MSDGLNTWGIFTVRNAVSLIGTICTKEQENVKRKHNDNVGSPFGLLDRRPRAI